MKSFRSYLVESEQTYKFRIKLANELSAETMDALETALEKYEVASISKPKKTPIQEHPMDFQTLNKETSRKSQNKEYLGNINKDFLGKSPAFLVKAEQGSSY